jgi:hypothetical protein
MIFFAENFSENDINWKEHLILTSADSFYKQHPICEQIKSKFSNYCWQRCILSLSYSFEWTAKEKGKLKAWDVFKTDSSYYQVVL